MKHFIIALVCAILFSCNEDKKPITTSVPEVVANQIATPDSTVNAQTVELQDEVEQEQVECVFDTSTYKFTTEALRKYDKNLKFYWDKEESRALVKMSDSDSLILSIGGCNHFGYNAIYITDSARFNDKKFMVQKARWLAKSFFSFGFDEKYVHCIDNNLYKLDQQERKDYLSYSIIDPDTVLTNHVYEGWAIEKIGGKARLTIGGYMD